MGGGGGRCGCRAGGCGADGPRSSRWCGEGWRARAVARRVWCDAFSLEFWGALLCGGVCVLQPGQRPDRSLLVSLVAGHGVTMLQLSAGLFNLLVDEYPQTFAGVRVVFTGGEPASAGQVAR